MNEVKNKRDERISISNIFVREKSAPQLKTQDDKTVNKEQVSFDKAIVKTGSTVYHKAFGDGTVVKIDGDIIQIKFKKSR